jgi:hypothetical protein
VFIPLSCTTISLVKCRWIQINSPAVTSASAALHSACSHPTPPLRPRRYRRPRSAPVAATAPPSLFVCLSDLRRRYLHQLRHPIVAALLTTTVLPFSQTCADFEETLARFVFFLIPSCSFVYCMSVFYFLFLVLPVSVPIIYSTNLQEK